MTPERLSRIRAIYEAALEQPPEERARFVEIECQGDEELRQEVERLLRSRERVPDWLQAPPLAATIPIAGPASEPAGPMEGRHLGGYTLIREIGRGGMASVYLAERSDGAFRKQVAIKLVRPGTDTAEILDRFRREREILASLDHPNIARLIDGGTTEDGVPYFVMEFVDGQPIHRWCDERKLNVTRRLELFRHVCDAVQYAHQRLVVHRDLKPSNIFVTNDGTVKLLDFGIAKVIGDEHAGGRIEATRTAIRLMTPEYASPEQVNGQPVTTLTDVYSLGVVLYELLTGHRPYRLVRAALHEIARVISEEEPTRPSEVVTTTEQAPDMITPEAVSASREGDVNRLRKRLVGDLDCMLLTALRKEPARRYSSVEAFGEDLRRHIENRPVTARADSVWYRMARFIRRHPSGTAAAVLISISLLAGTFATLWQLRVAIDASRQRLPARAILAPQITLFAFLGLTISGGIAYFSRATLRRMAGALAGGVFFAAAWWLRFRIAYARGWWRSAFADTPDPLLLFSGPLLLALVVTSAALLLIGWRITRRFGWKGLALFVPAVGLWAAPRDRVWWDHLMHVMVAAPGVAPVLIDAALLSAGIAVGYAVMRLIAGPAKRDALRHGV
ncbi:MAG TPA: serine/threonine-protein kinase [Bryobacteraceae bacterium]|nr:serine/threonine-protein kinase [Bryobacteraceae bacterium]